MSKPTQQPPQAQQNQQPAASAAKSPLDQLQAMLRLVLEHTATVFVEANRGGDKDRAAASAAKLRAIVPGANGSFHDALDELEAQVTTARWVLTRDLAALSSKPAATSNAAKDVDMADAPPIASVESNGTTSRMNGTGLSVDTTTKREDASAQPEPTTAASAMDFDSLFNDSASGTAAGSPTADASATPKASTADKDQTKPAATESADNDDVSSLLPGLESYANAAGDNAGTIDLSTPTPTKPEEPKPDATQKSQQSGEGTKPTDAAGSTFDDLIDFGDFDFGAFGAGDGTGLEDGGGATFDESFFDVE